MLEINNEQFYLLLYLMGLHPIFTFWLYHLLYKYCILINQQQKHSKQSTLPEWLTDWPTDWLTDRQFDWLTTWFVVIVVVMNHILRSPFLELIVEFLVRRFIQCYNKKWRHFSWRNMEIKYIYIYAKNSFGSSVESEFLLVTLTATIDFLLTIKTFSCWFFCVPFTISIQLNLYDCDDDGKWCVRNGAAAPALVQKQKITRTKRYSSIHCGHALEYSNWASPVHSCSNPSLSML